MRLEAIRQLGRQAGREVKRKEMYTDVYIYSCCHQCTIPTDVNH